MPVRGTAGITTPGIGVGSLRSGRTRVQWLRSARSSADMMPTTLGEPCLQAWSCSVGWRRRRPTALDTVIRWMSIRTRQVGWRGFGLWVLGVGYKVPRTDLDRRYGQTTHTWSRN